jgi:hypothetical protein
MSNENLTSVQSKSEFLDTPEGKSLFGSANAIDWFERINRKELVESGVLFKIRGKWCRSRPDYDTKVLEIVRNKTRKAISK